MTGVLGLNQIRRITLALDFWGGGSRLSSQKSRGLLRLASGRTGVFPEACGRVGRRFPVHCGKGMEPQRRQT